ncbi:ATP-binding protein [Kitasatospora sp. NRRL B-11411]|uniref:ATP-binding protein n=1 Tax=Kitasatospora sp. NRRL B-11411 TaxID=1463822 RepID=UPI0004C3E458|nr:ATP-binding protein [Kitasatospora sp. NRRL B-11411]
MTDDSVIELLSQWPGRFRFGRLAVALRAPEQLDEDALVNAVLRGIAEDDDEQSVFDSLVREGRLEDAEYLLENGPLLGRGGLSRWLHALTARRQELREELQSRCAALEKRADDADLVLPELDLAALEQLCATSWPETLRLLEAVESALEGGLAAGREALRSRLAEREAQGVNDPAWAESSRALVDAGLLRAAARQIDDGTRSSGPERVPALPAWNPELSPRQVLDWHLDPVQRQRQARYAGWAPADDSARGLVEAYASLDDGGFIAAHRFTTALTAFLGSDATDQVSPDEVTGGYLTAVSRAFVDPELMRFIPLGNLEVFVGEPETREPEAMGTLPQYLAVGPGLKASAERGPYAVLVLRDVLRLATLRTGRPTALMRLLGRQWPLAAFAGDTPNALDELLGPDEATRWTTLRWILDLSGLGDIVAADALAFATGWDPALLHLFLQALAERQDRSGGGVRWLTQWRQDRQFVAAVEDAVVRPLGRAPVPRLAFWAALAAAPAGEEVTADELLGAAQLVADLVPDADALTTAMAALARLRLTEEASTECVRFRRCGVLSVLGDRAEQRLETILRDWAAHPASPAPEDGHAVRLWAARRHGLSPDYEEYVTALEGSAPAPDLDTRLARLAQQTTGKLWDERRVDGTTDLVSVLRETTGLWQQAFPDVRMATSGPGAAVARISPRATQVLLYELLANAGEALAGSETGRVSVHLEPHGNEWIVDVRDSGHGITYPQGREDLLFRAGHSTKGEGRGDGLHRARAIAEAADGALLLVSRSDGHPILKGAHFRLILPKG